LLLLSLLTTSCRQQQHTDKFQLLERKAGLAQKEEWDNTKATVTRLLQKIEQNPVDVRSLLVLTSIYLQEARISGNYDHYNKAALYCINEVLKKDEQNFEALTFKSMILLSQHRFADALTVAEQAKAINPYNAFVYGLLVDGNIEMGNYDSAVAYADKMISIRPDNRSYARIAYLREIFGDIDGAIEAMNMAVTSGAPGDENTEWSRIQLARLYEKAGDINNAQIQYETALAYRPGYPYAVAGMAGIALIKKDYGQALQLYKQADSLLSDHTFKEGMIEIYTLTGQQQKAKELQTAILKYMQQFSGTSKEGQNETHELAHAYMGMDNYENALQYALEEYNARPQNIEVNETAAIVYYKKGNYAKALEHIQIALRTNCSNPELLSHAGLIYAKTGDIINAKKFLGKALKNKLVLSESLVEECNNVLKTLS
jgi:tetratricopeptide (TPR) repeat protein